MPHKLKILIACEFSGVVTNAFRERGHDAFSCDLLPTEGNPEWHLRGDVRAYFNRVDPWDLLIAFPPCTYLCNSGVRWLFNHVCPTCGQKMQKGDNIEPKRWAAMKAAAQFFADLWKAPVERIAIENPRMHKYATTNIVEAGGPAKYSQVIHPWQFGHGETKATGLWLKNLPPLQPTNIVQGRTPRVHYASPGPDRWKERSRTLEGVAKAMAEQWGNL